MLNYKQRLNKISTIIFDIDGVLTDGRIFVFENGEAVRNMNSKDGYALHLAVQKGYRIAVISGGNNVGIRHIMARTGINDVFINSHDKLNVYLDYLKTNNISEDEVMFIGDDLPDHEIMSRVGLPVCPNDAAQEIKSICPYVSPKNGGDGVLRDVLEQVMKAQGKWEIVKW
ncbi:MAG TPA: HAD hydrolase family protein [Bacteroidia bacterium]|nr:HAD hydrolase family protein [Bacteroidia bacterium]